LLQHYTQSNEGYEFTEAIYFIKMYLQLEDDIEYM